MATDSTPGPATPSANPPRRDLRSLWTWGYLLNYILLGASALLIVMEIIESGAWRKLGIPLLLLSMAIGNLVRIQAAERRRAEPGAAPDPARR